MKKQRNRFGGPVNKHHFDNDQHKAWVREMLAHDQQYPQYGGNSMRDNGRKCGMCECSHCGWKGGLKELKHAHTTMTNKTMSGRRPDGYCPGCFQRVFWAKLSDAQAAVLA